MRWLRLLAMCVAAAALSGCGVLGGGGAAATPTTAPAVPTVAAAAVASPSATQAAVAPTASAVPKPSAATPVPAAPASDTVWVGNTDGEGVYVRNTPVMADRARPYPDGTPLTIVGDDVDGDGQHWKHVKTPDGLEGYVPSIYTVDTPP